MIEPADFGTRAAARSQRPRLLAASFALLAALLLGILVVLVNQANHERDAALARKQHSFEVAMLTADLAGSLARAEAALGRYVIGKDPRTGAAYYEQWRMAGRQLAALTTLVHDNPEQARRARAIGYLYEDRDRELGPAATLILYKQQWSALSLFARAGKSPVLPRMNRLLRDMANSERTLLDERSTAAAEGALRSNWFTRVLSIVGVLLTLSATAAGWAAMVAIGARHRAHETADAEIERTAALELAVAQRTIELSDANLRLRKEAGEREDAETRLRQMQKMDAVGQLTGGIAHDFNNMLAVVIGGLELARKRVDEQATEATRHLDNAMEGAERAAELTRRLLSFARAEPLLPSAIDPATLVRGMSDLIDRTIGERIAVRIAAPAGLWPVWCDSLQLENALLNLCVNARDAMGGAGELTIALANVVVRAGEAGSAAPGDYVRLAVTDNGSGMSPETLERVFEPFFTTKPVGEGTGLGLSQTFAFARQSGGEAVISSALGRGTTVALYLPRHRGEAPVGPAPIAHIPVAAVVAGTTILVVEDDPRVRSATGEALQELGYRPLLTASADEALARLREHEDVVLLVTDVMMPGLTGPELAVRVAAMRPALPVLFVTGYVGEAGDADRFAGHGVLRKPFTLAALARAVGEALRVG